MVRRFRSLLEEVKTKYFGNRGAGAFFYCRSSRSILWAKRANKGMKEPGTWTVVFGGKCEDGEDPRETALREIAEELRFNKRFYMYPLPSYTFEDPKEDFKYFTFHIVVDHEFDPVLNWEHNKFMWLPLGKTPNEKIHFGTKALIKANII